MTRARRWRWRNVPIPRVHVVVLVFGVLLQRTRPWPISRNRLASRVFGWCVVAIGTYGVVRAVRAVGAVDTTAPSELVTTGAYAASRNPTYVAWTTLFVGLAFVLNTVWSLVLSPLVLPTGPSVGRNANSSAPSATSTGRTRRPSPATCRSSLCRSTWRTTDDVGFVAERDRAASPPLKFVSADSRGRCAGGDGR